MGKKERFERLDLLDLRRCRSVDDIVQGMSKCSFGARMIGEVADSLYDQISSGNNPIIVYDGKKDALGKLLVKMVEKRWFSGIMMPREYAGRRRSGRGSILVVGDFSERYGEALFNADRAIYVNGSGKARPGQICDGYFPDVVFGDPRFTVPLLYTSLEQRLEDKETLTGEFLDFAEKFGGVGEEAAHGARTLSKMVQDSKCKVVGTYSGAMTIAKMGLVVCDMIDMKMVNCIASTGALIAHGLIESVGLHHYKHDPKCTDEQLDKLRLNRVTDTLEPETNFVHIGDALDVVLNSFSGGRPISPRVLNEKIGKYLVENYPGERGILKSAYEQGVGVLIPAFFDSELGNDLFVHNAQRKMEGKRRLGMDMELDTQYLLDFATGAERIGIFTIGGGTPRNTAQNIAVVARILNDRLGLILPEVRYVTGMRICPDLMWYGHLGGCTYKEGQSWGKTKYGKGERFAEIHADATQVWPFIVKYVMDGRDV